VAFKLFLKNFKPLFLEKYQHLYKTSLAQTLTFVKFYHRLKYLHNIQCHSVFVSKLLRNDIYAAPILSRLSFNVKVRAAALRNRKIFYAPPVHTNVGLFSPINKLSSAANSVNADIFSDSYTKIRNSLLNTAKYSN
jgi:hypothetical protein